MILHAGDSYAAGHEGCGEARSIQTIPKHTGNDIGRIQNACSVASSTHGEENHMRQTNLFVAAALVLACVWGWASTFSPSRTAAAAPISVHIDPLDTMMQSKALPTSDYEDYSLVFSARKQLP